MRQAYVTRIFLGSLVLRLTLGLAPTVHAAESPLP